MADLDATYAAFAAERGLEPAPALGLGALTPLLVESKHCQVEPAARGRIEGEFDGIVGHLEYTRNKTFRFNLALVEVPSSTSLAGAGRLPGDQASARLHSRLVSPRSQGGS